MKITSVSTVVYRQSLKPGGPQPKFAGEGRSTFESLLVKVETDAGIVGWGEAFPHRVWRAVRALVETLIAPVCIGADPTDISGLMGRLMRHTYGVGRAGPVMFALSGLDTALWDILGKAANLPVYLLLGGPVREFVPTKFSISGVEPARAAEIAAWAVEQGFRTMKVKVGIEPEGDVARVRVT